VSSSKVDRRQDEGLSIFNKLLAQVQDGTNVPKSQPGGMVINNAPTEQDILANLLGEKINKMKIDYPPTQNISAYLSYFLMSALD